MLGAVINPDYQEKIGFRLHNRDKSKYAWSAEDPIGHLLVLPYPEIKVNGKLPQPNPGRLTKGTDP